VKKTRIRYLSVITASAWLLSLHCVSVSAAGNPEAGKEKSALCQGCHGPDGNSLSPEWPNLADQHAGYIRKQVTNFQKGERQDPTMSSMVIGLSKEDIADIAAYFSSQSLQATEADAKAASDIALGKKIYKGGNTYNHVPACAGCHGPNGVGNEPALFPRIAGQKIDYLIKTLNDFRAGNRANDPNEIMRNIAAKLSEREIKAVAAYASSL
jgi:cytochrome c553